MTMQSSHRRSGPSLTFIFLDIWVISYDLYAAPSFHAGAAGTLIKIKQNVLIVGEHRETAAWPVGSRRGSFGEVPVRLTTFTDYALRMLILAASKGDENVTIEDAAQVYGISAAHLKKVVRTLTHEGFLAAQRGRSGGFRLAAPPEAINLGQVIRATESDFALVECFRDDNRCVITRSCRLPTIVNRALQAMLDVFDEYTLADIVVEKSLIPEFTPFPAREAQPTRGPRIADRA